MEDKTTQTKPCRENFDSSSNLWLKKAMHSRRECVRKIQNSMQQQFPNGRVYK